MNYKDFLGFLATAIAFIGFVPYFRDIFLNKTKPHAFSWLIWALLTGIAFFGQISQDAGPGAWVSGASSLLCFAIFLFGLFKGRKNIVLFDWLCLLGAGIAILFWFITKDPLISIILITLIDMLGFIPTFRKSFINPHEETASTFFLSGLTWAISLFALNNVTIVTALYPISLVISNWLFVGMVLLRKKQLRK